MSLNDSSAPSAAARRVRRVALWVGGAVLLAFALLLATRQYNAHAPNESPPPGVQQSNAAALAAARQAGVGPATATAQNIIPGAIAPDVMGGNPVGQTSTPGSNSAIPGFAPRAAGSAAPGPAPGSVFGRSAATTGQRFGAAPLGGGATTNAAGAVTYPAAPAGRPATAAPALPYPAVASPPRLSPLTAPPGRAGAGPGMAGSPLAAAPR